jgi:hypothetical protein
MDSLKKGVSKLTSAIPGDMDNKIVSKAGELAGKAGDVTKNVAGKAGEVAKNVAGSAVDAAGKVTDKIPGDMDNKLVDAAKKKLNK